MIYQNYIVRLLSVWSRYIGHVTGNIGGVYEFNKNPNQPGNIYTPVTKAKAKRIFTMVAKKCF